MQPIKRILLVLSALQLAVLAAACAPAPTPAPTAVPPSPTALALPTAEPPTAAPAATEAPSSAATTTSAELSGAALYQMSCAACHGQDRAGSTFEKDGQKIDTPSLAWDELSTTYAADPSRGSVADQVAISITKGQDETGGDLNAMMPRWSSLSKAQIDSLVQYLQTAFP